MNQENLVNIPVSLTKPEKQRLAKIYAATVVYNNDPEKIKSEKLTSSTLEFVQIVFGLDADLNLKKCCIGGKKPETFEDCVNIILAEREERKR